MNNMISKLHALSCRTRELSDHNLDEISAQAYIPPGEQP
jgi:hypothetical protein